PCSRTYTTTGSLQIAATSPKHRWRSSTPSAKMPRRSPPSSSPASDPHRGSPSNPHHPTGRCPVGSFTETATHIAAARLVMTDRAGRWVTEQVGRHKRSVNEVAVELGCDWHTINDTVIAYGTPLVEDPDRIGDVDALGLDETLFARLGRWRHQHWSTS